MASGDNERHPHLMTYSKCKVPIIGALIDYMDTSFTFMKRKTFAPAEKLHLKTSKSTLSATFMAATCLMLGLASNAKFEVVTFDEEPLANDLHVMLMSKEEKLYIDDIDLSRVLVCIEASDTLAVLISCLLIWNSSHVGSPMSEYMFLPWFGATIRGLLLRQAPTVGALLYTAMVVEGTVNPLFVTAFSLFYFLQARMWMELARAVCMRWERRSQTGVARDSRYEVETLWSNNDAQSSVEVRNYVY